MANTRQCPSCKQWVDVGYRNERATFKRHIKACNPEMFAKMQAHEKELNAMPDDLAPPEEEKQAARAARILNDEPKPEKPKRTRSSVEDGLTIEWVRAQVEPQSARPGDYHFHIDTGQTMMHRHDGGKGKHDHDGLLDYGVSLKLMDKKAEAMR